MTTRAARTVQAVVSVMAALAIAGYWARAAVDEPPFSAVDWAPRLAWLAALGFLATTRGALDELLSVGLTVLVAAAFHSRRWDFTAHLEAPTTWALLVLGVLCAVMALSTSRWLVRELGSLLSIGSVAFCLIWLGFWGWAMAGLLLLAATSLVRSRREARAQAEPPPSLTEPLPVGRQPEEALPHSRGAGDLLPRLAQLSPEPLPRGSRGDDAGAQKHPPNAEPQTRREGLAQPLQSYLEEHAIPLLGLALALGLACSNRLFAHVVTALAVSIVGSVVSIAALARVLEAKRPRPLASRMAANAGRE